MHASAEALTQDSTARVATVTRLDRRPWAVRVRDAAAAANLPPTTRGFAVVLSTYFDGDGRWSLSVQQIADVTGYKQRMVFNHLRACRDAGLIAVEGGGGKWRNRYSAGLAVTDAPLRHSAGVGVQHSAPVRNQNAGSVQRSKSSSRWTRRTPRRKRRDPRDDDRVTCPQCGQSWPRRFGTECFACSALSPDVPGNRPVVTKAGNATDVRHTCVDCGRSWPTKYGDTCRQCNGRAREAIEREEAAQQRHDRLQHEQLLDEIANYPTTCRRCGYDNARAADTADTGRCRACRTLTDERAAEVRSKGEPIRQELVQAWKDRDHVRGKAPAQKLADLYATARQQGER